MSRGPLHVRVDNRIRMPRADLPEAAATALKSEFEHANPKAALARALKIWARIPPTITTWASAGGEFTLPRGGMGRLRAILREHGVAFRVEDAREEGFPSPDFPRYVGDELRWYQEQGIERILAKEQGILRAPTGCLSGDTEVELNRAGKSFRCDLAHLVRMHAGGKAGGKRWDASISTRIRMRDADGFIRLATVVDAYSSGRRETFEVEVESGRKIRATMDHRFMTPGGWKRLREIACGDLVLVDGGIVKGERKSKPWWYRLVNGINIGMTFLDPNVFAVHHLDEDPRNSKLSNLAVLPRAEHARAHGVDGGWRHVTARAVPSRVVSISRPRIEETFDVEVAEEEHNFLASGFVVHNSGKTTLAFAAIARVGLNAIVILPTKGLFAQWAKRAEKELGLRGDRLGMLGDGVRRLRPVTIAMQNTLWRLGTHDQVHDYFGHVLFDEAQLAAARTVNETLDRFPARYRIAVSADETRADKLECLTYDQFGEVIHEIERETVERQGYVLDVAMLVVPTEFRAPWYGIGHGREVDFNRLLREMADDEARNALGLRWVDSELANGEQCIMLTGHRDHARRLDRHFVSSGVESGYLLGEQERGDREEFDRTAAGLVRGDVRVGIGTYKALGYGIDLPAVAAGVAVTPISSNAQNTNQVRGRLCRPSRDKPNGRLYVLWDRWVYPRHLDILIANNKTVRVWDGAGWADARAWRKRNAKRLVKI